MTDSTGPKISSWAMVYLLSTSAKTVGWTNQPLSNPLGRPPPAGMRGPSPFAFEMAASPRSHMHSLTLGPTLLIPPLRSATFRAPAPPLHLSTISPHGVGGAPPHVG